MSNKNENTEKNKGAKEVTINEIKEVNFSKAAALNESLRPMNLDISMPSNVSAPKPEPKDKKKDGK